MVISIESMACDDNVNVKPRLISKLETALELPRSWAMFWAHLPWFLPAGVEQETWTWSTDNLVMVTPMINMMTGIFNFFSNTPVSLVMMKLNRWHLSDLGAVASNSMWSDEWIDFHGQGKSRLRVVGAWRLECCDSTARNQYYQIQFKSWVECRDTLQSTSHLFVNVTDWLARPLLKNLGSVGNPTLDFCWIYQQ